MEWFFQVYGSHKEGSFSDSCYVEKTQMDNIKTIAKIPPDTRNDSSNLIKDYFEKNIPLSSEERASTLNAASALSTTSRIDVYEISKDENGKEVVKNICHRVGKINPNGATYTQVDDKGQRCDFELEENIVLHDSKGIMLHNLSEQYLGYPSGESLPFAETLPFEVTFAKTALENLSKATENLPSTETTLEE